MRRSGAARGGAAGRRLTGCACMRPSSAAHCCCAASGAVSRCSSARSARRPDAAKAAPSRAASAPSSANHAALRTAPSAPANLSASLPPPPTSAARSGARRASRRRRPPAAAPAGRPASRAARRAGASRTPPAPAGCSSRCGRAAARAPRGPPSCAPRRVTSVPALSTLLPFSHSRFGNDGLRVSQEIVQQVRRHLLLAEREDLGQLALGESGLYKRTTRDVRSCALKSMRRLGRSGGGSGR